MPESNPPPLPESNPFAQPPLREEALQERAPRGWLGPVSLVLFALVALARHDWRYAVILLPTIALHELGHVAAMRLFGYSDVRILFIPFLGALATSRNPFLIPVWKKTLVSLAGPLPGILLACALAPFLFRLAPEWSSAVWILLVVNYFNWLPLAPLDGGQYLRSSLFAHFPRGGVVFAVFGGAALAFLGLKLQSFLLPLLALWGLLSIPTQWRAASLMETLREGIRRFGLPRSHGEALMRGVDAARDTPVDDLPEPARSQTIVMAVTDMEWIPPHPLAAAGFALLYVALWTTPLLWVAIVHGLSFGL